MLICLIFMGQYNYIPAYIKLCILSISRKVKIIAGRRKLNQCVVRFTFDSIHSQRVDFGSRTIVS